MFFGFPGEERTKYRGTGFFIDLVEDDHVFTYLVTARHVADKLNRPFILRANLKAGGSQEQLFDPAKRRWVCHPDDTVDIAATPVVVGTELDIHAYPVANFLTLKRRIEKNIGAGDLVNLVGLFRLFAGSQRNLPVVHTGHIALVPDEGERIPVLDRITGQEKPVEGYLVEAQTLDGLSGSPVFVRRTVAAQPTANTPKGVTPKAYGAVFLLGLYMGSWDGRPAEVLEAERGTALRVPVGMGIVVPAYKISEILEVSLLKDMRRSMIEAHRRSQIDQAASHT